MATTRKQEEETQAAAQAQPSPAEKPVAQEQAVVAYVYLPDQNPLGGSLPGVPLRSILKHEYDSYPRWVQRSIRASAMYEGVDKGGDDEESDK